MRGLVFALFRVPPGRWVRSFWADGAGFDAVYSLLFVLPYTLFARMNRNDLFSALDKSLSGAALVSSRMLVSTQNGNVRWYMAAIALGAVTTIIVAVFL
jgi:NADH-quinone oxidoreductase subunit L